MWGASYVSNTDCRGLWFEDSKDERSYIICPDSNSNCVGVLAFNPGLSGINALFLQTGLFHDQKGKVSTTTPLPQSVKYRLLPLCSLKS